MQRSRSPKTACLCPRIALAVLLTAPLSACDREGPAEDALPSLGANGRVTVSGVSSGAYMAGQYLVAYSGSTAGAAFVAGGPWGCARGDIARAFKNCISGDGLDVGDLHAIALAKAAAGTIDATENLRGARALVFRGTADAIIAGSVVDALREWLSAYVDAADVVTIADVPAVHGWPTSGHGASCDAFTAPYINDCDYDLAGEILAHLHGELDAPASETGPLRRFDQRAFGDAGLAEFGYAYVPAICRDDAGCAVHVFFHGCEQSAETIGTELAEHAGFNRWAETNAVVVLYPQVEKSLAAPVNPLGCWDWWGYTGENYLEQSAPQLAAVRQMVARLADRP